MKYIPKFSVVIAVYNQADSIQKSIRSVIEQHYPAEEIIVVDDGSTDNSVNKVKAIDHPNIRLLSQTHQGSSAARNNGVKLTRNRYIAFLEVDDLWSPFYLEKMKALILRFPKSKLFAANYQKIIAEDNFVNPKISLEHIPPNGGLLENYFRIVSQGDHPFTTSSSIIHRQLFNHIGGFSQNDSLGAELALFSESALSTDIAYSPLVLLSCRTKQTDEGQTNHLPDTILPFAQKLLDRAEEFPAELHADIDRYCSTQLCRLAVQHLRLGCASKAMAVLSHKASRKQPLRWLLLSIWSLMVKVSKPRKWKPTLP